LDIVKRKSMMKAVAAAEMEAEAKALAEAAAALKLALEARPLRPLLTVNLRRALSALLPSRLCPQQRRAAVGLPVYATDAECAAVEARPLHARF
jgi:hypothetical protein